jgi:hypothetical protein
MKNEARKMERSSVIMARWREEAQVFICVSVQRVGGAERVRGSIGRPGAANLASVSIHHSG